MPVSKEVRRVVTTHDDTGKSGILFDSAANRIEIGPGRPVLHNIWCTDEIPADMKGPIDRMARKIGTAPPPAGSIIRILDIPPTGDMTKVDLGMMQATLGPEHSHPKARKPRHPLMHRTRTIDYIIVMNGEMDMMLDEGEIHLKAGDVLVQQGTNHAWINRSGDVCRICSILIDAKEPLA
jgi:hypothetical protein